VPIAPERKVLVTGGASGFGLAIGRALVAAGARVAIADLRLEGATGERPDGLLAIESDVRSQADMKRAVTRCVEAFGGLDTLVVSAGVIHIKPLDDVTEADWDLTLDVNLKGAFLACQAAAPQLRASGRGRIVTIGSDCSRKGAGRQAAYVASKFGLLGLTESLAAELAADGVTANCVCPVGCPTTAMGQDVLAWKVSQGAMSAEEIIATTAKSNPIGRNATEADVVAASLFFLSEEAGFVTGVALDVDGGAHLGSIPGESPA
jgi:meso-butanediol dehydrogenase / (S,S)-butanediol dehydrogenase / diacetyl reductase